MNLFRIFSRPTSAPIARDRLQILLTHERRSGCDSNLIAILHKEVLAVISKRIAVDPDKVSVKLHQRETISLLEIDIEIEAHAINDETRRTMSGKAA